ncbi:MAG: hypothetical protein ACK46L_02390 [Synechococcaceae cyanobacterium]|jgi:hypothetical protein
MNQRMEAWCDSLGQQIVLTRSRAYKSNDQAWVGHTRGTTASARSTPCSAACAATGCSGSRWR